MFYPFIDHVVAELEERFSNDHEGLVAIQHLIPISLREFSDEKLNSIQVIMENF